jgi:hypothetical protein
LYFLVKFAKAKVLVDMIRVLLDAGAEVNAQNAKNHSPLFLLCKRCAKEDERSRKRGLLVSAIDTLVKGGADVDAVLEISKELLSEEECSDIFQLLGVYKPAAKNEEVEFLTVYFERERSWEDEGHHGVRISWEVRADCPAVRAAALSLRRHGSYVNWTSAVMRDSDVEVIKLEIETNRAHFQYVLPSLALELRSAGYLLGGTHETGFDVNHYQQNCAFFQKSLS